MTSLSIRQYVLGIYKQLGLRERDVTKVQTGGPGESILSDAKGAVTKIPWLTDGDLGSST